MNRQRILRTIDRFVELCNRVSALNAAPHDFGIGIPLTKAEIHMVVTVGTGEPLSVTSLATRKGITKGAVSQLLSRLERKGLIVRNPDPSNLSRVLVRLTQTGRKALAGHERIHDLLVDSFERHVGTVDSRRLENFEGVLDCIETMLEGLE